MFTNLFHQHTKFINGYIFVFFCFATNWFLKSTIFKLYFSCYSIKEDIFDRHSRFGSFFIVLDWVNGSTYLLILYFFVSFFGLPSITFKFLFIFLHFTEFSFDYFNILQEYIFILSHKLNFNKFMKFVLVSSEISIKTIIESFTDLMSFKQLRTPSKQLKEFIIFIFSVKVD